MDYLGVCQYCGHWMVPVVSVTRRARGYQCHRCGCTWGRDTLGVLRAAWEANPFTYLRRYTAAAKLGLAWFRLTRDVGA